eukprot:CAMPEP_0173393516 /NCGR_PEP_ID=MMETSP1356-20130122/22160_1 /TAXON_ID=77927 ORGANISM="Hemiselmis virescens, Strain PCC157" /NCGR_SAMPLE_ID=MMETSP1356 /ASSEMBLY_ACC=CAM_ASM_000847 /LENGTH=161 /DNA_ID=CAMNT_0014351555 /DNA_START=31 /DNA_END=516 /DNA_ORIENTATION=+
MTAAELQYGGMEEAGEGAERSGFKYRRTAAVLSCLCVAMLVCAKLSVPASHHAGGVTGLAESVMRTTSSALSQAAGGEHVAVESAANNKQAAAAKKSMFSQKAGWSKEGWTGGDWAAWIIPGPIVTVLAAGFIYSLYGPLWAAGIFLVMLGVDVFSFYVNI